MSDQRAAPSTQIFGASATPLSLDTSSLHRVRLLAASIATVAFVALSVAWDWNEGWLIVAVAGYVVIHAAFHLQRDHPLWPTLLTDILVVSLAIGIVRPPPLALITPIVYLVAAPMLLTSGRTAIRLASAALFALSVATLAMFELAPSVTWTTPRTLLMVGAFLAIFGPLIIWMIRSTSRQTQERELTRLELEATRNRLERVFRSAPVGMELTGIGPHDFLAVNPAFCDFLGYTEAELLTMQLTDVVHPDDFGAGMEDARRVARGDVDRFEQERRYIHADGRILWAHFSLSMIRGADGEPQYAIGQAQDITPRKVAEAERDLLLELSLAVAGAINAEEAMRSVLAGLCSAGGWSIGVLWVPSPTGMRRVHTWAAYPAVDVWSETTTTLAPGEGLVGAVAESKKPIEVPSLAENNLFLARDDAAAIGLDVALGVPVLAGDEVVGVLLFLGVPGVDPYAAQTTIGAIVGQLGQAIAVRLAEAERDRLAGILEHSTDFAGFSDPDGQVRYINPAGRQMLGLDPVEDVTTLKVASLHTPSVAHHLMRTVFPRVMTEGTWRGETTLLTRNGTEIPVSQVVLAHYDEVGEVTFLSTVARDISAQKQLEAQQADVIRSKDEFIASVSHELRTPLTAVRGFAEILHDPHADLTEEERSEMIAAIASESADVSDIVEDLLVAARSDIDQLTITSQCVDVRHLVGVTADRVRWGEKTVVVDVDCVGDALADPLRLRQILRNLLVNAVRYGGDSIRVTARTLGPDVVIEVADNGGGISEQFRDEIFAPYRRAHDRAGLAGSVGLGLAVSRRLARLMNGDVTYTHPDSAWPTFTLRLPAF
ncbi:MAG TPA: PAS domain S-box protein [Acidimicrobiia bacterium]|nr:PAS domain S-box protein [Acidimicrobiia bacterium]